MNGKLTPLCIFYNCLFCFVLLRYDGLCVRCIRTNGPYKNIVLNYSTHVHTLYSIHYEFQKEQLVKTTSVTHKANICMYI